MLLCGSANISRKLGRLDEARGAAQAGLALNPAFRIARTILGRVGSRRGSGFG
jgi:hypothetical protein